MTEKEEKVDRHDVLINSPLAIFLSKPYNSTFIEKRLDVVWATPKDEYSNVYSFIRPGNNVGLLKTSDSRISRTISIRNAAGALVTTNDVAPPPLPLCLSFKTKE